MNSKKQADIPIFSKENPSLRMSINSRNASYSATPRSAVLSRFPSAMDSPANILKYHQ